MTSPTVFSKGTYFIGNPRFLLNKIQLENKNTTGVYDFDGNKVIIINAPKKDLFLQISLIPMSMRPELDDGIHYDYINGD